MSSQPDKFTCDDFTSEWCLEVRKSDEWSLWLHGTLDEVLEDYYYHSRNPTYQGERWRIVAPSLIEWP